MKIAITGTRQTEAHSIEDLDALFAKFLGPFATPSSHWYLGGASGIDTLALSWLVHHSSCSISVAVPVRVVDQAADAQAAIATAQRLGRLHELVELAHPAGLGDAAYTARNQWLVDHAELLIGFPLTADDDGSGTWATLVYAGLRKCPRLIVPLTAIQ